MGLLKAVKGAVGGVFADQWREYFYCDAMPDSVLACRGKKRTSERSSNTKGEENIISNGSIIAVADKQCAIIIEQGKRVVEICAEPGEFVWDSSTEPSLFTGNLGESIIGTFKTIGKRFTFGGDTAKDQRVYYINTSEIKNNLYGTPTPVPFRVVDRNIGLDADFDIRCNGSFSYEIHDPILFYTNVCQNFSGDVYPAGEEAEKLKNTLRNEIVNVLGPALASISELQIRPSQIPNHTPEITRSLNELLTNQWLELRGIKVVTFNMNPPTLSPEDAKRLKDLQASATMRDPTMAAAVLTGAQADAMKAAASNEGGAMTGFMGMGMAMNAGGMNASNLFAMGQQQQQAAPQASSNANTWKCVCGSEAVGNFCPDCGAPKPSDSGWTCSCGAINKGKFCQNCGSKKPEGAPLYRCDKCGWEPEDPHHPPKFCPECGDPFDEKDIK